MKDFVKKNLNFAKGVEKAFIDLVTTAQNVKYSYFRLNFNLYFATTFHFVFVFRRQGPHKSRSHSFASMKDFQRKFVHELAEAFGCTTQSYDEEPNRNVVATAVK